VSRPHARGPWRRLFVIALLGLLAGALLPAGASAAQKGVVPDLTWGVSRSVQDQTAAALTESGAKWARMSISWSDWVEPKKGSYNSSALSSFDRGIDLARASGAKVLIMVEESPSWARDSDNKNSPPRNNADLADFVRFLATRYRGKVEGYEIWNEPNLTWAWPSGPNPAQYARMLKAVSPAVKLGDPAAKVVFAGTFTSDYRFLEGAYAAVPDLGAYFDVMGTHAYTYKSAPPERLWRDPNGRISPSAFAGYRELRRTMLAHGIPKPIWVTEFGWSTATQPGQGVSPQTQADYLKRAYSCLEQDPYVEMATWYNFRNEWWEKDADSWHAQLGLMNTDFTRKPAYYALKGYVPGTRTCTYSETSSPQPGSSPPPPAAPGPTPVASDQPPAARRSAMLAVRRARLVDGRLAVSAQLAGRATGRIRMVARYAGRRYRMAARVRLGRVTFVKRLPGGPSTARVTLAYSGDRRFAGERVTLRAAARSPRLRIRPVLSGMASSAGSLRVRGNVVRGARGSVRLRLRYQATDGTFRVSTTRAPIRAGTFASELRLPATARNVTLRAIFPGDPQRHVAGATAAIRLGA
jgi:hypothetical protein